MRIHAYLALCLSVTLTPAQAADVSVERIWWRLNDGGHEVAIKYQGGMKKGDLRRIYDAEAEAKRDGHVVTELWLNSWGGDGDTGLAIANYVAKRPQIDVFVDDQCVSACAYAALVALGQGRLLLTDAAEIGVHQVTDDATGAPDPAWTRNAAKRLAALGAPLTPLQQMCEQPPDGMRIFERSMLAALGAQIMKQPFKWSWW